MPPSCVIHLLWTDLQGLSDLLVGQVEQGVGIGIKLSPPILDVEVEGVQIVVGEYRETAAIKMASLQTPSDLDTVPLF